MLFQREQPLIHKIYYKQIDVAGTFLLYFVKPEGLAKRKNAKQLVAINLSGNNILPTNLIFIGQKAKSIVKEKDKEFLEKVVNAYIFCGKYILKKLPLRNRNLKAISSIDQKLVTSCSTRALDNLLRLPHIFINVLRSGVDAYSQEIRKLMVDPLLPSPVDNKGNDVECLTWWSSLEKKYPLVFKMIVVTLSIFDGPQAESSFSMMTDVVVTKSGGLNIGTYKAIQTVKYSLMASQVFFFLRLV